MSKYRVAIIGTGMIANSGHIPAFQALDEDVELVAVANPGRVSAEETAKRFAIPHVYTDPEKMLNEIHPDIVVVCSPNVSHKQWVMASLQTGAHVLCEKPLATSLKDAEEMFAAAETAGKMLYVAQTQRFKNENQAAKKVIDSGDMGEIYFAEANYIRRRGIPTWGKFHMKEHNAGGPLWDLGVHVLDFLIWAMKSPQVANVSGSTYLKIGNQDEGLVPNFSDSGGKGAVFHGRPYDYHEFNVEDFANGYIRLKNGTSILLKVSWAINLPESGKMQVAGTKGGLEFSPLRILTNQHGYQIDITPKIPVDRNVECPGHFGLAENFIKALQGKEAPVVKKEEVLTVMKIIDGLYRSAAEGKEITLD